MLRCYFYQGEVLVRDTINEQFSCTHSTVQRADTTKLCDKPDQLTARVPGTDYQPGVTAESAIKRLPILDTASIE